MLTLVCIVACSISQLGSRLARTPPSCDSKHRDAWRLFVTTFLFTPVSFHSHCSAVSVFSGCKPFPVFTFLSQLQNKSSRAREKDGRLRESKTSSCSAWRGCENTDFHPPHICRTFHRMADPPHISGIFELNCATLIPTLGLFECLPPDRGCQTAANSAWFVQIDPKPPDPIICHKIGTDSSHCIKVRFSANGSSTSV